MLSRPHPFFPLSQLDTDFELDHAVLRNSTEPLAFDVLPKFVASEYRIAAFMTLSENASPDDFEWSEELRVAGVTFRLKVYPAGTNDAHGQAFSAFLEMRERPPDDDILAQEVRQGKGGGGAGPRATL